MTSLHRLAGAPHVAYRRLLGAPAEPSDDLVSVIVTLYDYADHIEGALASIHAQDHGPIEVIVVDDRSSDGSAAVVEAWARSHAARFTGFSLLQPERNVGLSTARNIALDAAQGDHVFVLDADNECYPQAISKLLRVLRETGASAAYSQLEFFGSEKGIGFAMPWDRSHFEDSNVVDAMALFRRAALAQVGGYHQFEADGWEDYDLWCSFFDHGLEAVYLPEVLCRYRKHETSMLQTETNPNAPGLMAEMITRHPWLRFGRDRPLY